MTVGIIGKGAFGSAVAHLVRQNNIEPECVDVGDSFTKVHDVLFLVAPTQFLRGALEEHASGYDENTLIVNCAKGIEKDTCLLPQGIVSETTDVKRYAVMAGPSFAHEIMSDVPTVVDIALTQEEDKELLSGILASKNFAVEVIDQKTNVAIVSDIIHPDMGALKKAIESNEQRTASILDVNSFLTD